MAFLGSLIGGLAGAVSTVAPIGDPDYAGLHGSIALTQNGPKPASMLDSFFGLHPAMPEFSRMYRDRHAAVVHPQQVAAPRPCGRVCAGV